jgi:hypothetical protein
MKIFRRLFYRLLESVTRAEAKLNAEHIQLTREWQVGADRVDQINDLILTATTTDKSTIDETTMEALEKEIDQIFDRRDQILERQSQIEDELGARHIRAYS